MKSNLCAALLLFTSAMANEDGGMEEKATDEVIIRDYDLCQLSDGMLLSLHERHLTSLSCVVPSIPTLKNLSRVDLSNNNLTEFPIELTFLSRVHYLNLEHNKISSFPTSFGELTALTYLKLSYNHIVSLPSSITELINLKELDVIFNQIKEIPFLLSSLEKLSTLCLGWNKFEHIPQKVVSLPSLTSLRLQANEIRSIELFRPMPSLSEFSISWNKLENPPESISCMPNLRWLDISNTNLKALPYGLMALQELKMLKLHNHKDPEFAPFKNVISDISVLSNLSKLKTVTLENLPVVIFPNFSCMASLKEIWLTSDVLKNLKVARPMVNPEQETRVIENSYDRGKLVDLLNGV